MFDIGWSELLITAVIMIIVIGPKELPLVLRAIGRTIGKIKRMAKDFQDSVTEMAEVEEVRRAKESLSNIADVELAKDPEDVRPRMRDADGEVIEDPKDDQ